MSKTNSITFVVPVNDEYVYESNFMESPLFKKNNKYQIIKQTGFKSASIAYNQGINKSENEIIVFTHQDVVFPEFWEKELTDALAKLEKNDPDWGVLGCFGKDARGEGFGFLFCTGNEKFFGKLLPHPVPVQTLDEVVLILRKSNGLRFDEGLPHYHLYGTDICMSADREGRKCYAISAFCLHNTRKVYVFPQEFFECYKYIKEKWNEKLPIESSCIKIQKYGYMTYIKKRYYRYLKYRLGVLFGEGNRHNRDRDDPAILLPKLQREHNVIYEKTT
jgi:hypothetical protein